MDFFANDQSVLNTFGAGGKPFLDTLCFGKGHAVGSVLYLRAIFLMVIGPFRGCVINQIFRSLIKGCLGVGDQKHQQQAKQNVQGQQQNKNFSFPAAAAG